MTRTLSVLFADITLDAPAVEVTGVTTDSRNVVPGGLFMACRGVGGHGLDYLQLALENGAQVVAWEPEAGMAAPQVSEAVLVFAVPGLGDHVGVIADRFFGAPSEVMQVTGITGTNGKTTTAWLASEALGRLGDATAYMGTLGYGFVPDLQPSALTTPGCVAVHRRLHGLAEQGARRIVMEVSSHALDQGRVDGVRITTAAFTNLSRDHLDYHGDLQSYKAAKAKLFDISSLQAAVINVTDDFGAELAAELRARDTDDLQVIRVAIANDGDGRDADLQVVWQPDPTGGLELKFTGAYGQAALRSPMWGGFNAENLLVAAGILIAQGYSLDEVVAAMDAGSVPPGRLEVIKGATDDPVVIVDFAHTPDALAQALETVRAHISGKLLCVFGCGGERDEGKRAQMGKIAAELADHVVVTSDNPRFEDPRAIIAAILAGVGDGASVEVEADRAAAIRMAVASAGAGDAVLVAGKGSENYQLIEDRKETFSDRDVAADALGVAA